MAQTLTLRLLLIAGILLAAFSSGAATSWHFKGKMDAATLASTELSYAQAAAKAQAVASAKIETQVIAAQNAQAALDAVRATNTVKLVTLTKNIVAKPLPCAAAKLDLSTIHLLNGLLS